MQLNRKTRNIIAISIAGLLILYGILGQALHINIDTKTVNNVSMVLMVVAFILLFGGRKPNKDKPEDTNNEITRDADPEDKNTNTLESGDSADSNGGNDSDNQ